MADSSRRKNGRTRKRERERDSIRFSHLFSLLSFFFVFVSFSFPHYSHITHILLLDSTPSSSSSFPLLFFSATQSYRPDGQRRSTIVRSIHCKKRVFVRIRNPICILKSNKEGEEENNSHLNKRQKNRERARAKENEIIEAKKIRN